MKKEDLITILLGFIPFVIGRIEDYVVTYSYSRYSILLFCIAGSLIWAYLSYISVKKNGSAARTMLLIHIVSVCDLLLLGWQILIMHRHFSGIAGALTQFYFLPWLSPGFTLAFWASSLFPAYCMSFLVMLACSYTGCRLGKRKG